MGKPKLWRLSYRKKEMVSLSTSLWRTRILRTDFHLLLFLWPLK